MSGGGGGGQKRKSDNAGRRTNNYLQWGSRLKSVSGLFGPLLTLVVVLYCKTKKTDYLRGTIVIRTCDQHKKLYIPLFLLTTIGTDYYVPR